MTTLADYKAAITDLVPGSHPLSAGDLSSVQERAIARAISTHSKHRPRVVVEDEAGTGAFDYDLSASLAAWDETFSSVSSVEYPADDTDEKVSSVDDNEWTIYEKPTTGKCLRFLEQAPAVGETIRVTYTAPHSCTSLACTVEARDEDAVQALAAGIYAKMLVAAYTLNQDSTIRADSVSHGNQAEGFRKLAKDYFQEYWDHMGIDPEDKKPLPACVIQDMDLDYPGGFDRLTHPRKYR